MTTTPSRPRAGTIIWAVVLLAVAAAAFTLAVLDVDELPGVSALWTVTGLGGVLVIAALVALIARAGRPSPVVEPAPVAEPVETPVETAVETPVETPSDPVAEPVAPKPRAKKGQPVD